MDQKENLKRVEAEYSHKAKEVATLLGVRVVIALLEIMDDQANIRDVILKLRLVSKNFLRKGG